MNKHDEHIYLYAKGDDKMSKPDPNILPLKEDVMSKSVQRRLKIQKKL